MRTVPYDALETGSHQAFVDGLFAGGHLDLVVSAAGVLVPQADLERDVRRAAKLIETNFTGHVSTLLAVAARMRAQGRGTIVVLSSVAAVRPRKANSVYGSAKAGLDAFARGLADVLHGTGVRRAAGPARVRHRPDDRGHAARPAGHDAGSRGRGHRRGPARRPPTVWVPALAGRLGRARLVPRGAWRRVSRGDGGSGGGLTCPGGASPHPNPQ